MKKNAGFSLVELIIVIAIMAILVGVMAPQLIKYIEKTKISADTQLCDSVRTAVVTAVSDPEIVNSTDATTKNHVAALTDGTSTAFHCLVGDSAVIESLNETLGFDVTELDEQRAHMKSTSTKGKGTLNVISFGGNHIAVWINYSDVTGKKRNNLFTLDPVADGFGDLIYVD